MKKFLYGLLFFLASAGSSFAANCAAVPNIFVDNTILYSANLNANFAALVTCANTLVPANNPVFTGTITEPDGSLWSAAGLNGAKLIDIVTMPDGNTWTISGLSNLVVTGQASIGGTTTISSSGVNITGAGLSTNGTIATIGNATVGGNVTVGGNLLVGGSITGSVNQAQLAHQFLTTSGTFTTPSSGQGWTTGSVLEITLTGAGGGASYFAAGAGATVIYDCSGVAASTGISVTIGTGGAQGTAGVSNGTTGGTSSLTCDSNALSAGGGGAGQYNSGTGAIGTGGAASGGDFNVTGGDGGGAGSSATGTGGSSIWGGGGKSYDQSTTNGSNGRACGSGGGGTAVSGSTGGNGANGCAQFKWIGG